jgi:predicted transcriptional regulator
MNEVTEMFTGAQKKIDASVLGFKLLLDITMKRLREGVKVRWLVQESFLNEARTMLLSEEKRPEIRWTPRILGNVNVTDKAAMLTIRRNDGTMSYNSFFGEDASFLKWSEDLFMHEWAKAKPWYP